MVPVVSDYDDGLVYITLGEALGAGSIEIREVSEGGSVQMLTGCELDYRSNYQEAYYDEVN
jgi:hypothetical protein